jgi:hypothetical protein
MKTINKQSTDKTALNFCLTINGTGTYPEPGSWAAAKRMQTGQQRKCPELELLYYNCLFSGVGILP